MKKFWNWVPVFICLAGIAHFSQQQFNQQDISPLIEQNERLVQMVQNVPAISFSYNNMIYDSHIDTVVFIHFLIRKLAHITIYGLFGILLLLATKASLKNIIIRWAAVGMIVLLVASADETNQLYNVGRTGCKEDILMDFTGYILFGLGCFISSAAVSFNSYKSTPAVCFRRITSITTSPTMMSITVTLKYIGIPQDIRSSMITDTITRPSRLRSSLPIPTAVPEVLTPDASFSALDSS